MKKKLVRVQLIKKLLLAKSLLLAVGYLNGCSSTSSGTSTNGGKGYVRQTNSSLLGEKDGEGLDDGQTLGEKYPWELWQFGSTFERIQVGTASIREGDTLLQQNETIRARDQYKASLNLPLAPKEREAVTYRIASSYLREGKAESALSTLSSFFSKERIEAKALDGLRSLFLAYTYGQAGEIDQSLAWFLNAAERSRDKNFRYIIKSGVAEVVKSLHPEKFEEIAVKWSESDLIREAFALERRRRAQSGYIHTARRPFMPKNSSLATQSISERELTADVQNSSGPLQAVVLLPLSGKYGQLGIATKQGVELAFKEYGSLVDGSSVALVVEDSTLDGAVAAGKIEKVALQGQIGAVIGPLISEITETVTEKARSLGIPVLTLSKRTSVTIGNGIFRLGVTVPSQVARLVDEAYIGSGITRYAIIYPETDFGREYAEAARKELLSRGLTIAYEGGYQEGVSASLAHHASMIETTNVGGVIFPGKPRDAGVLFSSIGSDARMNLRPLGFVTWSNVRELKQSQMALQGALVVSPFYAESERIEVKRFVEFYRANYGKAPDFLAAQGYDAALLAALALRRATAEGRSFSSALQLLNAVEGTTGSLSISPNGEIERKYAVLEFINGAFLERRRDGEQFGTAINPIRGAFDNKSISTSVAEQSDPISIKSEPQSNSSGAVKRLRDLVTE